MVQKNPMASALFWSGVEGAREKCKSSAVRARKQPEVTEANLYLCQEGIATMEPGAWVLGWCWDGAVGHSPLAHPASLQ
jgi:hypothetical protein